MSYLYRSSFAGRVGGFGFTFYLDYKGICVLKSSLVGEFVMCKTFYSVVYAVWGSGFCRQAWFDDYAKAKAFAEEDYTDVVVQHTYTKGKSIKIAEERVAATLSELGGIGVEQ